MFQRWEVEMAAAAHAPFAPTGTGMSNGEHMK